MKIYLNTIEEIAEALQNEKVIFVNNDDNQFKLVNGIVFGFNGEITINPSIPFESNRIYTYGSEQLKLEVGKFYKTRDGRKAWITERDDNYGAFPFKVAAQQQPGFYYVAKDGKRYSDRLDDATDLVAPWEE